MPEYQVLARKYRPQKFCDVVGQGPLVTTLKNAIQLNRVSHAYLFCGPRGTGKTTLARIFAKAINCDNLSEDHEPCNKCSSCTEISGGFSLNVIEIDGASNRGIDDIRQINETVGYATSSGKHKIYIIDEVHMLTKEAFNALLKTLEEPPPKVKFFFATTEPHKVLPTILSRCQRFNLGHITHQEIVQKLQFIQKDMQLEIEEEAMHLIGNAADGSLRDAESILDQIITFSEEKITIQSTTDILGILPLEQLFELDKATANKDLGFAFLLADQIFRSGKDLLHCLDGFIDHFRNILLIHLSGIDSTLLSIPNGAKENYKEAAQVYTKDQSLYLLDFLIESKHKLKSTPSKQVALENIILQILRVNEHVAVGQIVKKLTEMEKAMASGQNTKTTKPQQPQPQQKPQPVTSPEVKQKLDDKMQNTQNKKPEEVMETRQKQSKYDTLLQFASVELGGKIKNKKVIK